MKSKQKLSYKFYLLMCITIIFSYLTMIGLGLYIIISNLIKLENIIYFFMGITLILIGVHEFIDMINITKKLVKEHKINKE